MSTPNEFVQVGSCFNPMRAIKKKIQKPTTQMKAELNWIPTEKGVPTEDHQGTEILVTNGKVWWKDLFHPEKGCFNHLPKSMIKQVTHTAKVEFPKEKA